MGRHTSIDTYEYAAFTFAAPTPAASPSVFSLSSGAGSGRGRSRRTGIRWKRERPKPKNRIPESQVALNDPKMKGYSTEQKASFPRNFDR
ncbi:unnamed protein product [Allacma fusca]|uniref:Uncharacterized protein n=1 Tax=Allacma fusca TaxID=39272 RepID=A0A8J2K2K6_9HEXA|nr:unnamed protein product [Allacma fusca]